jgi:hypothetical protein
MKRKGQRPPFQYANFESAIKNDELHRANRVLFDWLCDDADRAALLTTLMSTGAPLDVPSRAFHEDDPCPPLSSTPSQGHDWATLITCRDDVEFILKRADLFTNRPYRMLGSGSFMLGLDPAHPDWHAAQRRAAASALIVWSAGGTLDALCKLAVDQAGVASLARKQFDLAEFAEQAALRFCEVLFGFAFTDHGLLEDALRRGYRALTYLNLGRHFVSEPDTIPLAREPMARLQRRADELLCEYDRLERYPERPLPAYAPNKQREGWPRGVTPPSEYELGDVEPLLKYWAKNPHGLSGEQLAVMGVGLLVGLVGNVQASVCIAVDHILNNRRCAAWPQASPQQREAWTAQALGENPPVPFLPRLTLKEVELPRTGTKIPANRQLVLCLGSATKPHPDAFDPLIFGDGPHSVHSCLGKHLAWPLVLHIVDAVLSLPGLAQRIDPVTGDTQRLDKRWGFACESYPLEYRRDRRLAQQPLQVVMRIKSPVAENAARLKRLIHDGAPSIERALREARHVHFAWFQLIEGDTQLVLQTIYDGDFDAYIQHFALKVDAVFDQLFQFIEDAPPLPVGDFPEAFVEAIRRYNRAPAGGYFFSAYPRAEVWSLLRMNAWWPT